MRKLGSRSRPGVSTSQQILDSWERFQAERSLGQRVVGAATEDPDTIEQYFGLPRQGLGAWVHVPDEADASGPCEPESPQSSTSATTARTRQDDIHIVLRPAPEPERGRRCMTTTSDGDGLRRRVTG